jgi:hypothetical protein
VLPSTVILSTGLAVGVEQTGERGCGGGWIGSSAQRMPKAVM